MKRLDWSITAGFHRARDWRRLTDNAMHGAASHIVSPDNGCADGSAPSRVFTRASPQQTRQSDLRNFERMLY